MKYIDNNDLNSSMDAIPVYRGCDAGLCACLGTCQQIIGHVDRKSLIAFKRKSLDEFLTQQLNPTLPDEGLEKYRKFVDTVYSIECINCGHRYSNKNFDSLIAAIHESGWAVMDKGVICRVCLDYRL